MNWKEILMEDILRLIKEKKSAPSIRDVIEDTKVSKSAVKETIKALEGKKLVKMDKGKITLTEKGDEIAEAIYNYHRATEKLFGHKVAHSFEHMRDKSNYLKDASHSTPLDSFEEEEEGVIVGMEVENPKVLSRLMGIGLVPGIKFKIVKNSGDMIVLNIGERLIMVDHTTSGRIRGVKSYEENLANRPA